MSRKKKILVIVLSIVSFLMLFGAWYQYTYSMDEAASFEISAPVNNQKLLIATQGSDFKIAITTNIINHFKKDSIFIKVIDISSLKDIAPENFNAILLIHTWENWKPPIEIKTFIDRTPTYKSRIVTLSTSGEGSYKMEGIDAITGESKLKDVDMHTNQIIKKLNPLLKL